MAKHRTGVCVRVSERGIDCSSTTIEQRAKGINIGMGDIRVYFVGGLRKQDLDQKYVFDIAGKIHK